MIRTNPPESTTPLSVNATTAKRKRAGRVLSRRNLQPDRLVQDHLYLVGWASRRMFPSLQSADREDCEAVGRLALWKAAQNYDPARGKIFYSFALLCIRREMFRWAEAHQHEREKTGGATLLSLDAIVPGKNGENGVAIAEMLADENAPQPEAEAVKSTTLAHWAEVTSHLTPTQADVLRLYYGIGEAGISESVNGRTFAHVGKCLGVTSQRVHQIHQTALNRLRSHPSEALLLL